MTCRICRGETRTVLDLGPMPLANKLKPAADAPEKRFPLAVEFCAGCGNLQLTHCVDAQDLYDDYLYVTPTSPSLEAHSVNLVYHMQAQGYLGDDAFLLEFGSNIGHFLKYAQTRVGRVLGIDPAKAIVEMANARGVPTLCDYFGPEVAKATVAAHGRAQVVAGRHCAAHNADPHALVEGARLALAPGGVFVMENAYGLNTILHGEIGQIYHEHMYYYTARSVQRLFAENGLELIDLMPTDIHGGSMVFFGARPGHPAGALDRRGDDRPREGDPVGRAPRPPAGDPRALAAGDPGAARPLPGHRPLGLDVRRQRQGRDLRQRRRHRRARHRLLRRLRPRRRSAGSCPAPASRSAPRPRRSTPGPTTTSSPPGTTATS